VLGATCDVLLLRRMGCSSLDSVTRWQNLWGETWLKNVRKGEEYLCLIRSQRLARELLPRTQRSLVFFIPFTETVALSIRRYIRILYFIKILRYNGLIAKTDVGVAASNVRGKARTGRKSRS
jgi:hypothetical protein